jgi:hypothetical protein
LQTVYKTAVSEAELADRIGAEVILPPEAGGGAAE